MSMVFAGFMDAAREDRIAREEREQQEKLLQRRFDHAEEMKAISTYNKQRVKDAKLAKDVDFVMDNLNVPDRYRGTIGQYVEQFGADGVMDRWGDTIQMGDLERRAGTVPSNAAPGEMSANAKYAYDYFIEKGESPTMAAGIVGNLIQESGAGLNVSAVGDNGNAFGIAQHNGPRKRALFRYADQNGRPAADLDTQLDFLWHEANNTAEKNNWAKARSASTPEEAAAILSNEFWRPGEPHLANRQRNAGMVHATMFDDTQPTYADNEVDQAMGLAPMQSEDNAPVVSTRGNSDTETQEAFGLGTESRSQPQTGSQEGTRVASNTDGIRFVPGGKEDPVDISGLDNASPAEIDAFMVRNGNKLTSQQKDQVNVIREIRAAADNEPAWYLDREKVAGMSDEALRRSVAIVDDPQGKEIIEKALKANENPNEQAEWFSERIGAATSSEDLIGLQAEVRNNPNLTGPERDMMQREISTQMDAVMEREKTEAMESGSWTYFVPFDENGRLPEEAEPIRVQYAGGQWVDQQGNEVDTTKGTTASMDTVMENRKLHNTDIRKVGEVVSNGTKAVESIARYRQLVIENPSAVNNVLSVANNMAGLVKSLGAAGEALIAREDGTLYDYNTVENAMFDRLENLSAEDRRVAQVQLRAAYAMSALRGSTGQALSDKELQANLDAIGDSLNKPGKIVGLLNEATRDAVRTTEADRKTRWDAITMPQEVKAVVQAGPVKKNFERYLRDDLWANDPVMQQQLNDALADKTDYDFVMASNENAQSGDVQGTGSGGRADVATDTEEVDDLTRAAPQEVMDGFEWAAPPTNKAIRDLRANADDPHWQTAFDEVFGEGAAAHVLRGNQ